MQLLQIVKAGLPSATITQQSKDIIVKSKDREAAKTSLEKHLKLKKVEFESVFKKAKSSSIDVLVTKMGDIIFKPIIQKGAGGLSFEKELDIDLTNYFSEADMKDIKHKDVIKALETKIGINQESKMSVDHEGSKNQKRSLTYASNKITISNSSGETLTDITIKDSGKNKTYYLSLKMSSSYYILSASIGSYFSNKNTQVGICEYFGFDGKSMGGFGDEFSCTTRAPNYVKAKQNLKDLLTQAYGKHVVIIHKKRENDVKVSKIGEKVTLFITALNTASYVYPEVGKRKYANIKTTATISGVSYKVNFQFRGTTAADVGPKYLRILLERV